MSDQEAPKPAPAGWYPDPDQPQTQRYWDGSAWTDQRAPQAAAAAPQPKKARSGPGCLGIFLIVGVIAALIGVSGGDDEGGGGGGDLSDYEVARREFARATPSELEQLVSSRIEDSNPKATCGGGTCEVEYDGGEVLGLILSPEEELFEEQRDVWEIAFAEDRSLRFLILIARGKVESVGGKTSTEPVLRIGCSRRADEQINWQQVDVEGVQRLCDYAELVSFD